MLLLNNVRPDGMKNQEDPTPFIKYLLRIILAVYRDFEERIDIVGGQTECRLQSYAAQYPDELGNLPKVSC